MDLGAIFIGLAMVVASMPFVIRPFQENRHNRVSIRSNPDMNMGEKKKDILSAIHDLDFDYSTDKVSEDDYTVLRAQLISDAALHIEQEKSVKDDQLEAMISARKTSLSKELDCSGCGEQIRDGSSFCPRCGIAVVITCPSCNEQIQDSDQFCRTCGAMMAPKEEAKA